MFNPIWTVYFVYWFFRKYKILDRVALIIGGALFTLLGFMPALGALFFRQFLSGKGVLSYLWPIYNYSEPLHNIQFNSETIYRIATPTLFGICIMNIPAEVFATIPMYIRPLIGNGLLMGVLIDLALFCGLVKI
ncbi:hypothetical protein [Peribacillus simplex]|uniref:hypothetical protein n=1 Tax=Peribacillus simplex TaxID=1478 RepID=UPI00366C33B6